MKQAKGKQILVIAGVLTLIVVVGGMVVWRTHFLDRILEKKTVTPQKEQEEIIYPATPEEVTKNFYTWYLDCLDKLFSQESPEEDCSWKKSEYVSEKLVENVVWRMADPILCAQDIPDLTEGEITVEPAKISANTATVTVRDFYSWKNRPIDVELELVGNQWKIIALACSPLPPEWVAGEFYAWYINCRGGEVKGPLYLSGYCPYEERYSPEELFKKINEDYGSSELEEKISWGPGVDPILCAQDLPPAITVGEAEVDGKSASVLITEEFSPPIKIKVDLKLARDYQTQSWQVVNITCPERKTNE